MTLNSRAKKRDQILSAATKLFLQHGFEGTSMEAIRAEAGVSKPTLYTYYRGKEELFRDVLRQLIGDGTPDWLLEVAKQPLSSRQQLRETLNNMAKKLITTLMQPEYLSLVRIIIHETPKMPRLGALFRETIPERVLQCVSSVFEQADRQGIAKVEDPNTAARMFVGALLTYVLMDGLFAGEGPPRLPAPDRIESVVNLCMLAVT